MRCDAMPTVFVSESLLVIAGCLAARFADYSQLYTCGPSNTIHNRASFPSSDESTDRTMLPISYCLAGALIADWFFVSELKQRIICWMIRSHENP